MKEDQRYLEKPREYYTEVIAREKADIRFILVTLSTKPLISLGTKFRNELEMAGDRIAHIHPLRFLHTIFTDEELKVAIKNVRSRGWVWDNFFDGLKHSLHAEFEKENLTQLHLANFANDVQVEVGMLVGFAQQKRWDHFVDFLIRKVPRAEGSGRYD